MVVRVIVGGQSIHQGVLKELGKQGREFLVLRHVLSCVKVKWCLMKNG